jgi:hypothetical protein
MNSGDVFILDLGLELYQWQGKMHKKKFFVFVLLIFSFLFLGSESGPSERLRAALLVRAIDEERAGKPLVHVIDESDVPNVDVNVRK